MFDLFFLGYLKHPNQNNPCYRKVLSHALFRYSKRNSPKKVEEAIQNLKNQFDAEQPYKLEGYIGLYPFIIDGNYGAGYLIVDASRPVYPLVVYSHSSSSFQSMPNRSRYSALRVALNDVYRNRTRIVEVFNEHVKWDFKLEGKLEKIFRYKNDVHYSRYKKAG